MDLTRQIDGYCERLGPGFWAEPLNAATNAAFILAALVALWLAIRSGRLDGPVAWLIALTFAVGTGSFLFHTHATVWAAMTDTGPIGLFILSYIAIAMNRFGGFGWGRSLLLMLAFLIGMVALSALLRVTLAPLIGGSSSYVPALAALLGVGIWLRARAHAAGAWLLAAAGAFTLSLTFRALDAPLCAAWPAGTHFMWHLLNGSVLGLLLVALIRHGAAPVPPCRPRPHRVSPAQPPRGSSGPCTPASTSRSAPASSTRRARPSVTRSRPWGLPASRASGRARSSISSSPKRTPRRPAPRWPRCARSCSPTP